MKQQLEMVISKLFELFERFQEVSLRERWLVGITVAVIIVFGLQISLIDPLLTQRKIKLAQLNNVNNLNGVLNNQAGRKLDEVAQQRQRKLEAQILGLNTQISEIEKQVLKYSEVMIPAIEMPLLLQGMLANTTLELVSLSNAEAEPIIVFGAEVEDQTVPSIQKMPSLYRHNLTIKLRGSFESVHDYLSEMERQKWKLNWRSMLYEVVDYPLAEVEIEVQTLSIDERWLGV